MKSVGISIILAPILALALVLPLSAHAQAMDPNSLVDSVLCSMGMGCASSRTTPSTSSGQATVTPVPNSNTSLTANSTSSGGFFSSIFGIGGSRTPRPVSILYGATIARDFTKTEVTLVRLQRPDSVAGELRADDQIYEIIRGKKHLIPSLDIFFDYGFDARTVQFISQAQLDKYTRAKLMKVEGDKNKTVYYITENGLARKVLTEDVVRSYGERTEDIITISRKEFNFYPENKYIHLDQPFTPDVYVISGDNKRYLTPMAVQRLGIRRDQVSPVNQTEFNSYKTNEPVLY